MAFRGQWRSARSWFGLFEGLDFITDSLDRVSEHYAQERFDQPLSRPLALEGDDQTRRGEAHKAEWSVVNDATVDLGFFDVHWRTEAGAAHPDRPTAEASRWIHPP